MSVWFLNIKKYSKKDEKIITISFVLVFISAVLLFAHSAEAASATWTGLGADSLWATTGNWSTSPVPGTGDTATFNSAGNAKRTPNLGAGVTINSLLFDTASAAAYVIGTTNAQVLTWNDGGSFTMNSTVANTEQVKAKVIFDTAGGNYTITSHNTGRSFVFSDAGVGIVAFVGPASGSGTSTLNIVADGLISGFPTVSIRGGIQDGVGNAIKLVKSGAGSLQICSSSGGYTYTGGTYLNAGALLIVGNVGCIKSGTSLYIADAGTTLCSVNQAGGTYTDIASQWNGDWTFNDSTKGNSSLQQMTFTGGTVNLGSQNSGGTTANAARIVTALSNTLTINSVISNGSNGLTTGLTKAGAGSMVLTGANTYTGTTTVSAGTLQIGSAGTVGSLNPTGPIVNNSTLTFNRTNTITQGTDFGTISSGSGALTQAGTGKTILNSINNYSGTTTISAGTLQIGDGVTDGSIASSSKIINNAILTYNLVGARTYGNIISGTGQLFKLGTGTFTLTGVNTYTGTTTISGGTLQIGDGVTDGSIASSSKIINNDALIYNINVPRTYANPISGTGSLTKLGTGTLTISDGATYTGTTTVATGTLAFTTVVPASTVWDNSITNSSTYAVMTLPNNPDLTGKTINISSTATDNNYSTDLITWTGIAVGTPTLKLNGVIVSSGVYTGNTKITFNANAITFTRGAVPSAPTNLILTASSTEVILNWTAPSSDTPITDYVVDFKPTSTTTWSTFSDGVSTNTTATVINLTNGLSYDFRVSAYNAAGQGTASAIASTTPNGNTVPTAPTIGTATRGNAYATVTYTAPGSDGGSTILYYTITSSPGSISVSTTSPLSGLVTGLTNGTAYTFTVTATNAVGTSSPSAVSNSVTPVTVPDAPTAFSATVGNTQISLFWSAPVYDGSSPLTDYIVDYKLTSTTTWSTFSDGVSTNTTATVINLINGSSYDFRVFAINDVGQGSASSIISATPITVPDAPIIATSTRGNTQASVTFFPPVSNGGSTILSYTATSNPGSFIGSGASSPIIVTGLTNGTTYTFTVNATNAVGEGPTSTPSNSVTLSTEPGIPVNLAATVLGSSIGLSWSAPALDGGKPIIDYIVEYQLTTGGTWSVFADGTSISTTATVTGLSNDTSYDFRIRAVNIIGQSAPSATIAATPGEPAQVIIQSFSDLTNPSIGTNVRITNEGSIQYEYQYTWCVTDSSVNICGGGDDIFSAGAAKLIQPLQNYDFSATSTVPTPGTYWFHVNVTYGSKTSTAYQSFIAVATYPDAPTAVSAVFGDAQATVTFTPPVSNGGSIITSYKVTSSPGGITATGGSSPIIVSGLTNGTSYTFIVTATNAVGEGSASTPSNSVIPATIPNTPTGLIGSAGNAQVGLSWLAPINNGGMPITDYIIEYKLSTDSVWQVFADGVSTATNVIVTGLTNNLSYDFRVSAINSVGQSLVNSIININSSTSHPSGGSQSSYIIYQPPQSISTTTVSVPIVETAPPAVKKPVIPAGNVPEVIVPVQPGRGIILVTPTATSVISLPVSQTSCWGMLWYLIILILTIIIGLLGWLFFIILWRRRKKEQKEDDKESEGGESLEIKKNVIKRDDYFQKIAPKRKGRVDSL